MSAALATHKAVHDALVDPAQTALQALIDARVYDRVPDAVLGRLPTYPYVVIDRIDVRDDATTCAYASEVHATLRVISNTVGKREAETIGDLIRLILAPEDADDGLAIEGFTVSVSAFDLAIYRPADDPLLTEGVLTFTFLVDPTDEEST